MVIRASDPQQAIVLVKHHTEQRPLTPSHSVVCTASNAQSTQETYSVGLCQGASGAHLTDPRCRPSRQPVNAPSI
ncbi:hypothetical protein NDU88_005189 [Pleurodeles waltl]|uniref:Uncharacterized protein n=1 Tax=Pleurodeles waltl TaxID=8319 RepID=A0AAV7NRI6_PLEWA|nr:hypothetical protein NDU88_005189 [Pleurodeles waltl]